MRYFRKVVGLGDQVPFDAAGDSLDERSYGRLGSQRGWIVGRGRLLRVRFAGRVYLQGTRMQVAVRQSQPATPWQAADGGDATALSPSKNPVDWRARGAGYHRRYCHCAQSVYPQWRRDQRDRGDRLFSVPRAGLRGR